MPATVVRCTEPGCSEPATAKIAAPWTGGRFQELKTYGYACPIHQHAVLEHARDRPKPPHFAAEEKVGELGVYNL